MSNHRLFSSFFVGGFECSTHKLRCGKRLDMLAATGHDRHVEADYARMRARGIRTAREGLRWHLIEETPNRLDFSSVLPSVRAAREAKVQVIWDLLHFGWPDDLDVFSPEFVERFARMARGFAKVLAEEEAWDGPDWIAPVNEISFLSWTAGETATLPPFATGRGAELKRQLVRAAIAATEAFWSVRSGTRVLQVDPVFHVVAAPDRPQDREAAEAYRRIQFEAWDLLSGRKEPELGGNPKYLDVIGVNYYPWNQWVYRGSTEDGLSFGRDDPRHCPFREILGENFERYRRPILVAETGAEGEERASWLNYVGREVRGAIRDGVPVEGVCLYPIVSFPGWENGRDCRNGLWEAADEEGNRPFEPRLAAELRRQRKRFARLRGRSGDPTRSTSP